MAKKKADGRGKMGYKTAPGSKNKSLSKVSQEKHKKIPAKAGKGSQWT